MKKRIWIGLTLFLAMSSLSSYAQEAAPADTAKGTMLGIAVTDLLGGTDLLGSGTGVSGNLRYWSDYLGGDFLLGFQRVSIDSSGMDLMNLTLVTVGAAGLLGVPIGPVKPHVRVGFSYSYGKQSSPFGTDASAHLVQMTPSIAVDFKVAQHLVFGFDIVSFPFLVWAEVADTGIDGYSVAFMNSIRLAYVF